MGRQTFICTREPRCERHDRDLHGYPCHACDQEYWRRHPTARGLLLATLNKRGAIHTLQNRMRKANTADVERFAAYDGPHDTTVAPAGPHGPVSRLWNALCVDDCPWSHYWLPSKQAAEAVAAAHREDPAA